MPEPAPALVPLAAPLTTTHRVISYTYPSTLLRTGPSTSSGQALRQAQDRPFDKLRTGDTLYCLTGADYSTGESFAYTYPSTLLRTCDPVGNRLGLTTGGGVVNYEDARISTN